jgi:hypothetical protein
VPNHGLNILRAVRPKAQTILLCRTKRNLLAQGGLKDLSPSRPRKPVFHMTVNATIREITAGLRRPGSAFDNHRRIWRAGVVRMHLDEVIDRKDRERDPYWVRIP